VSLPLHLMFDCIFFRARIQADWQQFLKSSCSSDLPAGAPVTGEEFRRVALVVALAISNPRK
jgi:hypothetical protein